jgi:hypothetical protein
LGLDELGMAPLENDLFENAPSAKPAPAKPAATSNRSQPTPTTPQPTATIKPVAARPASPPNIPVADAAPNNSLGLDELGMAPLVDDLFGSPPPAQPIAAKPTVKAIQPAPIIDEDAGINYELAPAVNLADLPVATATSASVGLPDNSNPYAAPQSMTGSATAGPAAAKLPLLATIKDFYRNYFEGIKYGIGFSLMVLAIILTLEGIQLGIGFTFQYLKINRLLTRAWLIIFVIAAIALLIIRFFANAWMLKGFIHLGNCIANRDYEGAARALDSPGTFRRFLAIHFLNFLILVVAAIPAAIIAYYDPIFGKTVVFNLNKPLSGSKTHHEKIEINGKTLKMTDSDGKSLTFKKV